MSDGLRVRHLDERQGPSPILILLLAFFACGTLAFAGLWLRVRYRAARAQTVSAQAAAAAAQAAQAATVAPETPKEIVKEVPAKLTAAQTEAIAFARRLQAAPASKAPDDVLHGISSVRLNVIMDDSLKAIISPEQLTNKLETLFRQGDIHVDPGSGVVIGLNVQGFWEDDESVLTYSMTLVVVRDLILLDGKEARRCFAPVWREGFFARVGKVNAEEALLRRAGLMAGDFAHRLLAVRKQDEGQKR